MYRLEGLAQKIVTYSSAIKSGEKVVIQMTGNASKPLVEALRKEINVIGAYLEILDQEPSFVADMIRNLTLDSTLLHAKNDLALIHAADVCIMVKSIDDPSIMANLPDQQEAIYDQHYRKPMDAAILETTRWISLRYPNPSMAQKAAMSYEAFEAYYFDVCNIDYRGLSQAMEHLCEMMRHTKKVKILGPDTDLTFSIDGMPVHKCDGRINLPDGEVYTAPIKKSVKGHIRYNVASIYHGLEFESIYFEFEDGKIVMAKSSDPSLQSGLEAILDTDDGARYIGEFALGVNPYITRPTHDILFDEKIAGSFHLTPGFSYKDAFNGNESAIHWDLVAIQTEVYGGGEIYFDDVLIRKNGQFLKDELKILNP